MHETIVVDNGSETNQNPLCNDRFIESIVNTFFYDLGCLISSSEFFISIEKEYSNLFSLFSNMMRQLDGHILLIKVSSRSFPCSAEGHKIYALKITYLLLSLGR